jgi:hypothetical protein
MVAVATIAALVVVGGGAFAGYKLMGNGSDAHTTQAVITPAPEPAKAAAPEPAKAPPPADPPPAPPAEAKGPDAKPGETAASAAPQQPKLDAHPAAAPVAVAPAAKGRPAPPPAAPRPAPAPAKAPAKPPGQGTPDFGY